jgi:flagellar motor switch protein FliM
MSEALSHEEIAALQQALQAGRIQAGRGAAAPRGRVRQYDFSVPDKFSKDTLRALQHLHDGLARSLTTSLSAHVRGMLQVDSPVVTQETYQQFIAEVAEPSVLAAFSSEPLPGTAVWEIEARIAFPIIDRLLGGPGHGLEVLRSLTEIEMTVMQRVVNVILDQWREAWSHTVELHPKLLSLETNPLFLQIAGPNEIVLAVALPVHLGPDEGQMRLCLPFPCLEPILGRLAMRAWSQGPSTPRPGLGAEMARALQGAEVAVHVELGRASMPLSSVVALRAGDVVPLPVPVGTPATVYVGDSPKFRGRVGRLGRRLAVEITAIEVEEG